MAAAIRSTDVIAEERFRLHLAGVSYEAWARMARWQIRDFLARHAMKVHGEVKAAKKGLPEILNVILGRILGI